VYRKQVCHQKIKATCAFNEIFFSTEAWINITITTAVSHVRCGNCTRLEWLKRHSPQEEEKVGFRVTAYRTQRIERKIISYLGVWDGIQTQLPKPVQQSSFRLNLEQVNGLHFSLIHLNKKAVLKYSYCMFEWSLKR